jgi:cyclohexadienyl dehydratase
LSNVAHPVRTFLSSLLALCLVATPALTAAQGLLEAVRAAGTLRVCIWPDYYGVTWRNPRTGELSGLDVRLSQAFASDLGVTVTHIDSNFATFIDDLVQGRCDIAMFGVGKLPERAEKVRFSSAYLRSDIWAVTTRTHPTISRWDDIDRSGHVVAVQEGTFMEPVMRETLQHARLTVVAPPASREQDLRAGRIDAFMTDYPYSRRMIDNAPWARVLGPNQPLRPLGYGYAVAPGDDAWHARVEQFVSAIKRDGRLLAAARAYRLDPIVVVD